MKRYGPWVPIYIMITFMPLILLVILLLPETLTVDLNDRRAAQKPAASSLKKHLNHGLEELLRSLKMLKDRSVPLIIVTFFVQNARFTAHTQTLSQYVSKHFGWKLADTSLLLSPLGILNLVILGGLPKVSDILMSPRFRMTAFGKDLLLTRISTCLLIVGAMVSGFSHSVVMFIFGLFISTFGAADSPLARATVTHYVPPEFTSRLYALIGMVEVLGTFIAGPVLAWWFDLGLRKKGLWIGLPWFYVGILCLIAWVALLFVLPPKKHSREDYVNGEEDEAEDFMPDDPLRLQ